MLAKCFRVKRIKLIRLTLYLCIKFYKHEYSDIQRKVRGFVSRITTDKKKHLAAGFAICAIVSLLFGYVIGLIAATIAGAEKEARDYITKKGTPEFADFAYTVVGAFMFIAFSVVLSLLVQAFIMLVYF